MKGIRKTVGVGLTAILVCALGPALAVAQLRDWDGEWLPPITTNCTTCHQKFRDVPLGEKSPIETK